MMVALAHTFLTALRQSGHDAGFDNSLKTTTGLKRTRSLLYEGRCWCCAPREPRRSIAQCVVPSTLLSRPKAVLCSRWPAPFACGIGRDIVPDVAVAGAPGTLSAV